jgi:hypothetical protein
VAKTLMRDFGFAADSDKIEVAAHRTDAANHAGGSETPTREVTCANLAKKTPRRRELGPSHAKKSQTWSNLNQVPTNLAWPYRAHFFASGLFVAG